MLHRAVFAALLVALPGTVAARELQPLNLGWEHLFSVTWDVGQRHGRPIVEGYVHNDSPYGFIDVRVLVDSLDADGHVVDQRVSWVLGELGGAGHLYFNVPVVPAAHYRVRIFSYNRIESASFFP
jgi:hypothetical protein